jgi:hypothetical protein
MNSIEMPEPGYLKELASEGPQKKEKYIQEHPLLRGYIDRASAAGLNRLADGLNRQVDHTVGNMPTVRRGSSEEIPMGMNIQTYSPDEILEIERNDYFQDSALYDLARIDAGENLKGNDIIAVDEAPFHRPLFANTVQSDLSPGHFSLQQTNETIRALLEVLGTDPEDLTPAETTVRADDSWLMHDVPFMGGGASKDLVVREAPVQNRGNDRLVVQILEFTWVPTKYSDDTIRQEPEKRYVVMRVIEKPKPGNKPTIVV